MTRAGRRRRREGGVALLEIAILSPIVFFLLFALLEFGLLFRDQLTAQDAVGDAARLGAIMGPDVATDGTNADFQVIKTIREGLGSIPPEWVQRIVIFRGNPAGAGSPTDQLPATCKGGTAIAGRCNVYDPFSAFTAVEAGNVNFFNCAANPTSPACSWQPELRDDGPEPANIQYLGVFVRIRRDSLTGVFADTFTIDRAFVLRLEPGTV